MHNGRQKDVGDHLFALIVKKLIVASKEDAPNGDRQDSGQQLAQAPQRKAKFISKPILPRNIKNDQGSMQKRWNSHNRAHGFSSITDWLHLGSAIEDIFPYNLI